LNFISLYIHIPFCENSKCDYCDFYSVVADEKSDEIMDLYIKALIEDIKYQLDFFNVKEICTVYIGGGTPSALGAKKLRVLLDALNAISGFSPIEFSIEANTESVTEEFLSVCREGGINRISLGVQTFNKDSRFVIGRRGDMNLLKKQLALVSNMFPGAFSADLITGLPFQSEESVKEDIKRLLAFNPVHVSLYSLTLEEGTPLEKKSKSGAVSLPDGDTADKIWLTGRDTLINAGFRHYEVSNFALDGKRCLHNIRYWNMDGWLGAGPGASGTIINEENGTAERFTYAPDLQSYINSPCIQTAACEKLDKNALIRETLLMGYRYIESPDKEKFKRRFGLALKDCIPKTLERWKEKDKMLFLNQFLRDAFLEIEANTNSEKLAK
jgi:oxygen-independent coproporphyrinogen III oxidase